MRLRKPGALLLAAAISSTGLGCAAVDALTADSKAGQSASRASAERLTAIARVYEDQGNLDRAEHMYRLALQRNPGDQKISEQLNILVASRNGHSVPLPKPAAESIPALQGTITAEVSPAIEEIPAVERSTEIIVTTGRESADQHSDIFLAALEDQTVSESTSTTLSSVVVDEAAQDSAAELLFDEEVDPAGTLITDAQESAEEDFSTVPTPAQVTIGDLLAVQSVPGEHVELLTRALTDSDHAETAAFAAALLSECSNGNGRIAEALLDSRPTSNDPVFVLAVCTSLAELGAADEACAVSLNELARHPDADLSCQAMIALRHLAGTSYVDQCIETIGECLNSDAEVIRIVAAATAGDIGEAADQLAAALREKAESDTSADVRQAAQASLIRLGVITSGRTVSSIRIEPLSIHP